MKKSIFEGLPVRYPFRFSSSEMDIIRAGCPEGSQTPSMECLERLAGPKALAVVLLVYHSVEPKNIQKALSTTILYKTVLRDDRFGRKLTVYYRIPSAREGKMSSENKGHWEHVFRIGNPTNNGQGGLDGELITHKRQYRPGSRKP